MERIYQEHELELVAHWLLEVAGHKRIWLLTGEMGAGKTSLVAALMKVLNCKDEISSPTYALINEYQIQSELSPFQKVWHADLFRLKSIEEALDAGVEEMIHNADIWNIIEWPQLILDYLPKNNTVSLNLQTINDKARKITVNFN